MERSTIGRFEPAERGRLAKGGLWKKNKASGNTCRNGEAKARMHSVRDLIAYVVLQCLINMNVSKREREGQRAIAFFGCALVLRK